MRARVTLVFCDLVDSTALLARLGEQRYDEVRHDLFDVLERPVALHGGVIVKNLGDGLMLAFETQADDALACAVAMQRHVTRLGRRDPDVPLAIRVGIASGEATKEDGDWFGTPVVEAARLCSYAATAEVLVTGDALVGADLPARCSIEDRGLVTLKGFPAPVAVAAVRWPAPEDDGRAPLPVALDVEGAAPLTGRDAPMDSLAAGWTDTLGGAIRVAVITGAAGMGKTRLLAELASRAHADGAAVLYGTGSGALTAALRGYAASAPLDDLRRVAGVDGAALASAVPLVGLRLPELAAAKPSRSPSPAGTLVARVLARISADRPVLIVLDDLHRTSPAQLGLLMDVLSAAPARVLVACSVRAAADGADGEGRRLLEKLESLPESTIVELGPIDDRAAEALARAVLRGDAARWAPLLCHDAGGSPARVITAARALLIAGIDGDTREAAVRAALRTTAPYKGLPAFQTDEADLFFGRTRAVDAVLDAVARSPFVAVIGASGSGKSSLVRAGVLSRLRAGALPGSASWERRIVTPMDLLGAGLADHTALAPDHDSVLFVDQLEELFTMIPDADERARIANGLVDAAGDRLRVIVALRADFFGHCAAIPRLADSIVADDLLLGAMDDDELRETVTGPAAVAGVELEPGLADVVVADVAGQPGALPLLSHAMYETWNRRSGLMLTVADYREAGGVRGAIARTADDVFRNRLDGEQQAVARAIFLRATEPGEGTEDTRRRVSRGELTIGTDPSALGHVLDVLVDARMLIVDGDSVEVAHEALIREWPLLREWLDEDREGLRLHRALTNATQQWTDGGRERADLYRGARLDRALEWTDAHRDLLNEDEVAFLDAALDERAVEKGEVAARLRAQTRANRRLRGLLAGVGIALVVALIAGGLALTQRSRADDQARLADARRLAVQVRDLAPTRPDLAMLLAVEAFRLDPGKATASSLQAALREKPTVMRYLQPGSTARAAEFLSASGLLAVADEANVRLWDPNAGTVIATLGGPARALAASADGSRLAALPDSGGVQVWDVAARAEVAPAIAADGATAAALSPDGLRVAVGSDDGTVRVLDVATGGVVSTASVEAGATAVAWSPNGDRIAVTGNSATVVLADPATGAVLAQGQSLEHPTSVRFSPDSAFVEVSAGLGPTFLDASNGATVGGAGVGTANAVTNQPGSESVAREHAAYSPTDDLAVLTDDTTVSFARRNGAVSGEHQGFDASVGPITDVSISADGKTLAVAGRSIALVALDDREQLKRSLLSLPGGGPLSGEASPDGHLLLVSSASPVQSSSVHSQVLAMDGYAPTSPVVDGVARFRDDTTVVAGALTPAGAVELRVLDATTGGEVRPPTTVSGVSPTVYDGNARAKRIVFATTDGSLLVVEEQDGSVSTRTIAVPGSDGAVAKAVAFDATGDLVVVVTAAGVPVVIDVRSSARVDTIDPTLAPKSLNARFRPDGKVLAVATDGGDIVRFNTKTWARIGEPLRGLAPTTVAMAYTPDGDELALMGEDDKARIIDLPTGQLVGEPLPAASAAASIAFARDGHVLLAATSNGMVVWDLDPAAWVVDACRAAGRNLTQEEWDKYLPGRSYAATCTQYR